MLGCSLRLCCTFVFHYEAQTEDTEIGKWGSKGHWKPMWPWDSSQSILYKFPHKFSCPIITKLVYSLPIKKVIRLPKSQPLHAPTVLAEQDEKRKRG